MVAGKSVTRYSTASLWPTSTAMCKGDLPCVSLATASFFISNTLVNSAIPSVCTALNTAAIFACNFKRNTLIFLCVRGSNSYFGYKMLPFEFIAQKYHTVFSTKVQIGLLGSDGILKSVSSVKNPML